MVPFALATAMLLCPLIAAQQKHLKILAFGDSLTEGLVGAEASGTQEFHPYSQRLQELLQSSVDHNATVVQSGMSGEHVIPFAMIDINPNIHQRHLPPMVERLPLVLENETKTGQQFDWAVIMGGINDLGSGKRSRNVFAGLRVMYEMCEKYGVKVLAMTILESSISSQNNGVNQLNEERKEVNELIREYVRRAGSLRKIELLDIEKMIPWSSLSEVELKEYWSDGVHLTKYGYDTLGEFIFQRLRELFKTQPYARGMHLL